MPSPAASTNIEGRSHRRERVLKKGRIILGLHSVVEVVVRDLSAKGAQLRVPPGTSLPPSFELALVAEELLYPAELRWVMGDKIGIQFTAAPRAYNQHRNLAGGWQQSRA